MGLHTLIVASLFLAGCTTTPDGIRFAWETREESSADETCAVEEAENQATQATLFREAETERASQLTAEIARLQADLKTAEEALVEAESGLSASHTRADAVSSLAVARIQVERAAGRAPWRKTAISGAREKLIEAERQVDEGRFGAALFFVYRARRVAESILQEAEAVIASAEARLIRAERVNLRAGPSTDAPILSVLDSGTPVIAQTNEGDWVLVQVTSGPAGWIHRRLLGGRVTTDQLPASRP